MITLHTKQKNSWFRNVTLALSQGQEHITIHDFYEHLSPMEKTYLHQLHTPGNYLDMIKVKAILDNAKHRHLQHDYY